MSRSTGLNADRSVPSLSLSLVSDDECWLPCCSLWLADSDSLLQSWLADSDSLLQSWLADTDSLLQSWLADSDSLLQSWLSWNDWEASTSFFQFWRDCTYSRNKHVCLTGRLRNATKTNVFPFRSLFVNLSILNKYLIFFTN